MNTSFTIRVAFALSAVGSVVASTQAYAQAYCALRDPVSNVYKMFPNATSYRSIVRAVGERARQEVGARLPFELHYNELGRHTLYIPVNGDIPLGVVRVRTEASQWGLVEVAWAFDLDLRVIDFRFQRCRDPNRSILEGDAFRKFIIGKSFDQLLAYVATDKSDAVGRDLGIPEKANKLAMVVLRSALKTMVVTNTVWTQDLRIARLLARSYDTFPDAAGFQLVETPYTPGTLDGIRQHLGTESSGIDRDTIDMVRVTDTNGSTFGFTVRTDWTPVKATSVIWWNVLQRGTIERVDVVGALHDRKIEQVLASLAGASADSLSGCATAIELAALEVLVVCQLHSQN